MPSVHISQILGAPLYLVNRELYDAYMSLTKACFGLLITTMTQWWAPTVIRISGDASAAEQLSLTPDGRVQCDFPERMVLIANHQVSPTRLLDVITSSRKPVYFSLTAITMADLHGLVVSLVGRVHE